MALVGGFVWCDCYWVGVGVGGGGGGTGVARLGLTVGATVLGVSVGSFGFSSKRSLASPFLWTFFFLTTVSPLRPRCWARNFSSAFSVGVVGRGRVSALASALVSFSLAFFSSACFSKVEKHTFF